MYFICFTLIDFKFIIMLLSYIISPLFQKKKQSKLWNSYPVVLMNMHFRNDGLYNSSGTFELHTLVYTHTNEPSKLFTKFKWSFKIILQILMEGKDVKTRRCTVKGSDDNSAAMTFSSHGSVTLFRHRNATNRHNFLLNT